MVRIETNEELRSSGCGFESDGAPWPGVLEGVAAGTCTSVLFLKPTKLKGYVRGKALLQANKGVLPFDLDRGVLNMLSGRGLLWCPATTIISAADAARRAGHRLCRVLFCVQNRALAKVGLFSQCASGENF